MICQLYDSKSTSQEKAHGCACHSPVCQPSSDCEGHLSQGKCTVPAIVWKKIVLIEQEMEKK
jgi:hypothetical protein